MSTATRSFVTHTHRILLQETRSCALGIFALVIVIGALSIAPMTATAQHDEPPAEQPVLTVEKLHNGINRPVMIRITAPEAHAADAQRGLLRLAVLDHHGEPRLGPIAVRPGRMDLAERMPDIWNLQHSAWLQCLLADPDADADADANAEAGGATVDAIDTMQPIGTPLILQPMLTRMVPIIGFDTRPTGEPFARIVGWRSTLDPEVSEEDVARLAEASKASPPSTEHWLVSTPKRISSGLRIYRDQDVVMETTHGSMRFALRPDAAPNTAWNFLQLCAGGFYDDVIFHRIVPLDRQGLPFVIQGGDPSGDGQGGPGYWLPIEPSTLAHDLGVLSMARADDPDSAGSQFFVCLSREGTARLDGQYCAFGQLVAGSEALRLIADVELADVARGRPAQPPVIRATRLVDALPRVPRLGRLDLSHLRETAPDTAPQPPSRTPGRVDR